MTTVLQSRRNRFVVSGKALNEALHVIEFILFIKKYYSFILAPVCMSRRHRRGYYFFYHSVDGLKLDQKFDCESLNIQTLSEYRAQREGMHFP